MADLPRMHLIRTSALSRCTVEVRFEPKLTDDADGSIWEIGREADIALTDFFNFPYLAKVPFEITALIRH